MNPDDVDVFSSTRRGGNMSPGNARAVKPRRLNVRCSIRWGDYARPANGLTL